MPVAYRCRLRVVSGAVFGLASLLVPSLAHAQSSVAGVVRDASGAVLPGVTVEAASPVLIEKVRNAVTDGTGQYRLTELPPGPYSLTFTLAGFTTVKRDGVEVSGSGAVITINADLRVGGVQETITVTGETPGRGRAEQHAAADGARRLGGRRRCPLRAATATCWRPCRASSKPASTPAPIRR